MRHHRLLTIVLISAFLALTCVRGALTALTTASSLPWNATMLVQLGTAALCAAAAIIATWYLASALLALIASHSRHHTPRHRLQVQAASLLERCGAPGVRAIAGGALITALTVTPAVAAEVPDDLSWSPQDTTTSQDHEGSTEGSSTTPSEPGDQSNASTGSSAGEHVPNQPTADQPEGAPGEQADNSAHSGSASSAGTYASQPTPTDNLSPVSNSEAATIFSGHSQHTSTQANAPSTARSPSSSRPRAPRAATTTRPKGQVRAGAPSRKGTQSTRPSLRRRPMFSWEVTRPAPPSHGKHATSTPETSTLTQAEEAQTSSYQVKPGDTLWDITRSLLEGDSGTAASDTDIAATWPRLYENNRHIIGPDPDLIHPGDVLDISESRQQP